MYWQRTSSYCFIVVTFLFFTCISQSSGDIAPAQLAALQSFYEETSGTAWFNNDGWLMGDPCQTNTTWFGVSCDPSGVYVTELELGANNLISSAFPTSIESLVSLKTLNLSENSIHGTLPENIGNLEDLQVLNLGVADMFRYFILRIFHQPVSTNSLYGSIPTSLFGLTKLEYLNLAWNNLDGTLPDLWGGLDALTELVLAANRFDGSLVPSLANMDSLELLDLSSNTFTGIFPEDWAAMTSTLQYLYVNDNSLSGTAFPDWLSELPNIVEYASGYCSLTGTIPHDIGTKWPYLRTLHLVGNYISGTLPDTMPSYLVALIIGNNLLEGTIPSSWGSLYALQHLVLYGNPGINGTIPNTFSTLYSLKAMHLEETSLSGSIPQDLSKLYFLSSMRLSRTQISGQLPETLASLPLVELLIEETELSGTLPRLPPQCSVIRLNNNHIGGDLSPLCDLAEPWNVYLDHNELVGTLPTCLVKFNGTLRVFDVSYNQIEGTISAEYGSFASLTTFSAASNQLEGAIPTSLSKLPLLSIFDISRNNMQQDIGLALDTFKLSSQLTSLKLAYNGFHGEITAAQFFRTSANAETPWASLTLLDLSSNPITGPIMPYIGDIVSLTTLSLSGTEISGTIPDSYSSIQNLFLTNMPYLFDPSRSLPRFVRATDFYSIGSDNLGCPVLESAVESDSIIEIDPDYYGRELCVCQNHHYKDAGSCVACPSNANCDEGTLIIDRGYFPIVYQSNGQNRTDVAECFEVGRNETSCNPDSSLEYECAEGYEDYLCSKCMNGYFMESRLCSVCPSNSKSYGYLAIAIFVLVVVFWYFLSRPFQPGSERDLIPPSALFCVQATNILISTIPMRWPQIASKSNSFLLDWSNASLNWLSCLNVTLFQREYSLHFYTEVVSSLIIFSVLCASIRPIRVQAVRMIFRVLNCSYLMLAVQTLQVFGCGEEAHTGRTYVLAMPWVSCDPDDETYKSMYLVGIQTLLVFVFGVPMLQLYLVWRAASWGQARPYQPDGVCAWINHQLYKYHDGYLFWEVWVYFRRLIIAFLVVPLRNSSGDSTPVRSFLLVVVIAGNLGAHVYFMPFLSKTSNMLEILSLSTVLFIYTCGNIFSLYDDDSFVQYCFVAYLFMVFLVFALVIVVQLFILYLPQVLGETRVVDTIIEYDQEEVRRWQVYESDSSEGDTTWFRWSR
eukprot:Rmarinus@m.13526